MDLICDIGYASWEVEVDIINVEDSLCEVRILALGKDYHLLIGKHEYGLFFCIPDRGICCNLLGSKSDRLLNDREIINEYLQEYEIESILCVINELF